MNNRPYTTTKERIPGAFVRTFFNGSARPVLLRYLSTVLKDFFFLQFAVKFGFKKIRIVSVDHPLDTTVPFVPDKVSVYLDFVAFWIRPLVYIGRRSGRAVQLDYTKQFLGLVDLSYRRAAEVYRFRMSTTERPKYYRGNFLTIHLFDPHYLCVPSLHVMVVVLAYTFYRKAFAELGYSAEEQDALNRELFAGAVEITETVLYIKQHSVNCIPAALYSMTHILNEETMGGHALKPEDLVHFIDQLFHNSELVRTTEAAAIRTYICDLFEHFLLEGCHDTAWTDTIYRWIVQYEKQ